MDLHRDFLSDVGSDFVVFWIDLRLKIKNVSDLVCGLMNYMITSFFIVCVIFLNVCYSLDIRFTEKITMCSFKVCGMGWLTSVVAGGWCLVAYNVYNSTAAITKPSF